MRCLLARQPIAHECAACATLRATDLHAQTLSCSCAWGFAQDDDLITQLVRAGLRAGCYVFDPQSSLWWEPPTSDWAPDDFDVWDAAEGNDVDVAASVIRGTMPQASDQAFGTGINIETPCVAEGCQRASVAVRGSVVADNHGVGVRVRSSDVVIEDTVVRGTLSRVSDGRSGRGIGLELPCDSACDPIDRGSLTVRRSVSIANHEIGLFVAGGDATIEAVVVRDTAPRALDDAHGRGVEFGVPCVNGVCDYAMRSAVTMRGSVIERSREAGIVVGHADALIEGTIVRATEPRLADGAFGRGIHVNAACDGSPACSSSSASATILGSIIESSREVGILVLDASGTIEGSVVRTTLPSLATSTFGDGIGVAQAFKTSGATITSSVIADSARAGVTSFGSVVTIGSTAIRCAAFDLDVETAAGNEGSFVDAGGNLCGCPAAIDTCAAVSTSVEAPMPLPPLE